MAFISAMASKTEGAVAGTLQRKELNFVEGTHRLIPLVLLVHRSVRVLKIRMAPDLSLALSQDLYGDRGSFLFP